MTVQELKEGDSLKYIDKFGVTRNGVVLRNRTIESDTPRLFLTVQDEHERVEVIRDSTKVLSLV